jgi:hypothetical protein
MGVPAFDPVDRNRGEDSTSCGSHFVEAEFILAFYSYGQRDDALIELRLSIPCGSGPLKANCQSARCRLSESAYRVEPLCCGMRIANRSHQIRMVGGAAAQAESVVAGVNAQGIPSVHERDAGNRPSSQQVVGRSLGMLPELHMQLLDSDHRVGCTGQVGMERLKNTPLRMENTGSASGESCFGRCLFRKSWPHSHHNMRAMEELRFDGLYRDESIRSNIQQCHSSALLSNRLEQTRREVFQIPTPRLPFVIGTRRLVEDVLDTSFVERTVQVLQP